MNDARSKWRPRGALSWSLTIIGSALAAVFTLALIYMLHRADYDGVGVLGFYALMFAPQLLPIGLVALLVAIWMWWKRAPLPAVLFAVITLMAIPMSLVPTIAMLRMARQYNVSVSFASALLPDVTLGGVQRDKSIRYATVDGVDLMLDVWQADNFDASELHPAMIRLHGGAWIAGTRSDLPAWNTWLNQLGYQVFDVEYRMPPPARWRDEVADVKCAMGWISAHAKQYSIDSNRISILGYSAGGHLAMLAAYSMGDARSPPSCDVGPVKVRTVVNIYGPSDLALGYYSGGSLRFSQNAMNLFLGGPPEQYPDRYRDMSPITYINVTTPPTITLLGTSDRIVSVNQAEVLTQKLQAAGVEHETYLLPATDHGFDANWSSLSAQFARAKVLAFLQRHD